MFNVRPRTTLTGAAAKRSSGKTVAPPSVTSFSYKYSRHSRVPNKQRYQMAYRCSCFFIPLITSLVDIVLRRHGQRYRDIIRQLDSNLSLKTLTKSHYWNYNKISAHSKTLACCSNIKMLRNSAFYAGKVFSGKAGKSP